MKNILFAKYAALRVIIFGFVMMIVALFYGVVFAGIPYQDPTPELQASYAYHSVFSGYTFYFGLSAMILGFVLFLAKRL